MLISSGQPSLNPRLVKEADALTNAGYAVTVLYCYWNDWGTWHDQLLLPSKKWRAIRAGGDPVQKRAVWFLSRAMYKVSSYLLQKTGNHKYFADAAIARGSCFLIKEAKKHPAALYIAHNLGALPATVKAARLYKMPCGFDAEDFHRQELNDDTNSYHFKMVRYVENKYLPFVNYMTASSPLIGEKYAALYKRTVTSILNVFAKTTGIYVTNNDDKPLRLFWFSQTAGPNRGLETIIEAIALAKITVDLHILGKLSAGYGRHLLQLWQNAGINRSHLYFHEPVMAYQLFEIAAQFDIGLASETGFCLNNNLALSNKIFTFIQSGLAVAAGNTSAQSALMKQYPQTGKTYGSAAELAAIITGYDQNRELLFQTKKKAFKIGQERLNWDIESQIFLGLIKNVLSGFQANYEK